MFNSYGYNYTLIEHTTLDRLASFSALLLQEGFIITCNIKTNTIHFPVKAKGVIRFHQEHQWNGEIMKEKLDLADHWACLRRKAVSHLLQLRKQSSSGIPVLDITLPDDILISANYTDNLGKNKLKFITHKSYLRKMIKETLNSLYTIQLELGLKKANFKNWKEKVQAWISHHTCTYLRKESNSECCQWSWNILSTGSVDNDWLAAMPGIDCPFRCTNIS